MRSSTGAPDFFISQTRMANSLLRDKPAMSASIFACAARHWASSMRCECSRFNFVRCRFDRDMLNDSASGYSRLICRAAAPRVAIIAGA